MRKWREEEENQKGMITLEACISVLFFLVLMLLLAGVFRMFMAQNATAHAALETAESLALDAYAAGRIGSENVESVGDLLGGIFELTNNDNFSTYSRWYRDPAEGTLNEDVAKAVKKRFIGYLSGGDSAEADNILRRLNVVDGIDGIDFSSSCVNDGVLYVELRYQLEYDVHIGNFGKVAVIQKACSKLWK